MSWRGGSGQGRARLGDARSMSMKGFKIWPGVSRLGTVGRVAARHGEDAQGINT